MQQIEPLVTPEFVAMLTGADVSDTPRVEFLIQEASQMVCEWIPQVFTPDNAPTNVRHAVAILTAGALDGNDEAESGDAAIKAEQIGDYRVEFHSGNRWDLGLDLRRVEWLLEPLRLTAYSVVTDVPTVVTNATPY